MADGEKFNRRLTAVWWTFLFVGAMCLMLIVATTKTIVIADSSLGEGADDSQDTGYAGEMNLVEDQTEEGLFRIPLEEGTKAGNVVVENSYLTKELYIFIGGADAQFYTANAVQGDVASIKKAECKEQRDGALLCLHMDSVYEFQTSMEDGALKIRAGKPKDYYDMVVVVDPAVCEESSEEGEEELTLAVCRLLAESWDMEGIKLYFTRIAHGETAQSACLELIEAVEADVFIRLDTTAASDVSQYGIRGRYNGSYFIPHFGNVELADILTRNVTIASGNRAVGLLPVEEDTILQSIRIPAACVELGYLSNVQESGLLEQEEYRQKLAEGIKAAIREVYTNYYEQNIQ